MGLNFSKMTNHLDGRKIENLVNNLPTNKTEMTSIWENYKVATMFVLIQLFRTTYYVCMYKKSLCIPCIVRPDSVISQGSLKCQNVKNPFVHC